MSSLPRRMQRKFLRAHAAYEAMPQPTFVAKDGSSYRTLRPTKGWLRVASMRLLAQGTVARLLDHVKRDRPKKLAKVWRKPMPGSPSAETRQQRRWAARQG